MEFQKCLFFLSSCYFEVLYSL